MQIYFQYFKQYLYNLFIYRRSAVFQQNNFNKIDKWLQQNEQYGHRRFYIILATAWNNKQTD